MARTPTGGPLRTLVTALFLLSPSVAQTNRPPVLLFAGDLTLSGHVLTYASDDDNYVFERWSAIGPFDVFMANLEHPITKSETIVEKEFNFKLQPRRAAMLTSGGITIVTLANNHIGDFGSEGILETIQILDTLGIRHVGAGRGLASAREPVIVDLGGARVGFLGYYGRGTVYGGTDDATVAPRIPKLMSADVRALKRKADWVVVNLHWGVEKATEPLPEHRHVARMLVDAGANIIVGHHPHVLQGIEVYKGATIAYSLGNFVFGGNSRHSYETAVLRVEIFDTLRVSLLPIAVDKYRPSPADSLQSARILRTIRERSAAFPGTIPQLTGTD